MVADLAPSSVSVGESGPHLCLYMAIGSLYLFPLCKPQHPNFPFVKRTSHRGSPEWLPPRLHFKGLRIGNSMHHFWRATDYLVTMQTCTGEWISTESRETAGKKGLSEREGSALVFTVCV